jgi:hypothetical protein
MYQPMEMCVYSGKIWQNAACVAKISQPDDKTGLAAERLEAMVKHETSCRRTLCHACAA